MLLLTDEPAPAYSETGGSGGLSCEGRLQPSSHACRSRSASAITSTVDRFSAAQLALHERDTRIRAKYLNGSILRL